MAITNKEIINNQLRRINEKMKTNFVLSESFEYVMICRVQGEMQMPPYPLSNDLTQRTEEQMIEYLAGVEDAVDFYTHNGTAKGD